MTTVTSYPDHKPDPSDHPTTMLMDPLRTPPIYADLLPMEVVVSRQTRRIGRYATFALVLVLVLLALWYGLEIMRTSSAETTRDDTLESVQNLKRQQAGFDELVKTQAEVKAINAQLASLMNNDIVWAQLTAALVAAAPDDVHVVGISAAVPATGVESTATTPIVGPPSVKVIGTFTINGTGPRKDVIALYVDALDTVPGLVNSFLTNAAEKGDSGASPSASATADPGAGPTPTTSATPTNDDPWEFSITVDISSTALDNRYKPSAGASAGVGQ